jgi:hypothetical protein
MGKVTTQIDGWNKTTGLQGKEIYGRKTANYVCVSFSKDKL